MKPLSRAEADVLALSAQLQPVEAERFDDVLCDLWVSAADSIGYNCYDYNCKGIVYLDQCYVLVFQSIKGFQVIRRFICEVRMRIPYTHLWERTSEVSQLWITPRGEKVELKKPKTRTRFVAGWRHDYWATGAQMRASVDVDQESYIYKDEPSQGSPETIYVDSIAKNAIGVLAKMELNMPIMEKIEKKVEDLANGLNLDWTFYKKVKEKKLTMAKIYTSVNIANRHGYPLMENIDKWLELISIMLQVKDADIQNPVYICPTHIEDCIKYFTKKLQKQKEKEAEEARRREAELAEKESKAYKENMQRYLGIVFDTETLQFHVLQDVEEFYEEAKAMHHCVYKSKYYTKYTSLILSCTDKRTGKRVSTIEVDLTTMQVRQNYAACDKVPANDNEIRQAVKDNIDLIKNAA